MLILIDSEPEIAAELQMVPHRFTWLTSAADLDGLAHVRTSAVVATSLAQVIALRQVTTAPVFLVVRELTATERIAAYACGVKGYIARSNLPVLIEALRVVTGASASAAAGPSGAMH
jgi:DNA-binding NarL/FixJ family response regulator